MPPKKILIVDDDVNNRTICRLRFEHAGYKVDEAENGESGLAMAQQILPDLILLDVMMPKMDGFQVCRFLKTNPKTCEIPVLMLTARSLQIEELRGYESGADEYLTKPVDHQILLQAADRLLLKPSGA